MNNINTGTLYSGNPKIGYISPKFDLPKNLSLKESVQLITRKLINEFCKNNNLIVPDFVLNVLDLYQDYVHTKGEIESRGIIQLYTVYFVLHLVSAYWSAIVAIEYDIRVNKGNIINAIAEPKAALNMTTPFTSGMRDDIIEKSMEAYKLLKPILTPGKNKNITIGIKYFLFKHPVGINWKYYDTILYQCLILLTIIYNMVYTIKSVANFNKRIQKNIQVYVHDKDKKRPDVMKIKVFPQLFLLHAFMIQHGSRQPYTKSVDMEKAVKKEDAKYKNNVEIVNSSKNEENQKLYNTVENSLHGINRTDETDKDVKTMGIYSILNILFQLMYYHPFPYDPSQLESKTKKALKNHPVNAANQQRQLQVKATVPKGDSSDYFSDYDKEQFQIMGEIGNFFTMGYGQVKGSIRELSRPHCYKTMTGRKKCALNQFAEKMTLKALKKSGSKKLYNRARKDFGERNRGLTKYMRTQKNNNNNRTTRYRKHSGYRNNIAPYRTRKRRNNNNGDFKPGPMKQFEHSLFTM